MDVPRANLAGVVHHGIPLDRYAFAGRRTDYLAFLGRMTDQKRPDRAIALARQSGLTLKLAGPVDAGNPTYFDNVVKPHLDAAIQHVGNVTDDQKQGFLSNALALMFPIDWPEPFGLVMIEAMACGTPVIGWDEGSVREIVDDGVTGIIVNSVEEALDRLPEIRNLDPAIIRKTFEQRFSADRMAREITDLYRQFGV